WRRYRIGALLLPADTWRDEEDCQRNQTRMNCNSGGVQASSSRTRAAPRGHHGRLVRTKLLEGMHYKGTVRIAIQIILASRRGGDSIAKGACVSTPITALSQEF